MSLEKVIKYSVPLFVLAIVSRSIEEISFFYYAVPVLCVFYIVLVSISSKSNKVKKQNVQIEPDSRRTSFAGMTMEDEPSFQRSPESSIQHQASGIQHQVSRIWYLITIPGIWFLLTSLWSSYPEISAARGLYFILVSLGCISAGILWVRNSDKNILSFLLPANVIVILVALFSLITNIPSDSWTGGHGKGFMGFFGHQNLLASVLLFTFPAVLNRVFILANTRFGNIESSDSRRTSFAGMTLKSDPSFRRSPESEIPSNYLLLTTYYLLLTANLLLLILTYSRSAIVALIFGVIVYLILNRNWKALSYGLTVTLVTIIVVYSVPSFNHAVDTIIKKDFPEVYSSRMWMWEPSYKAALEGGLFGLGYGISHPDIRSGEYSDRFENGRLIREKGNSVLALVEESGLIGLILFLLPIIYMLIKLLDTRYQIPDIKDSSGISDQESGIQHQASSILFTSLAAFILHAQFEAWWVGVGSVQLPLFFIYVGLMKSD